MWLLLACVAASPVVEGGLGALAWPKEGTRERSVGAFVEVAPGASLRLLDVAGPGQVVRLWMTFSREDRQVELRSLTLQMWWDGELAVEVPAGDFFGLGHGEAGELVSLPVTARGMGLASFWKMPFLKSARIEVRNDSPVMARIYYQIDVDQLSEKAVPPYRFQATWKRTAQTTPNEPVVVADIRGEGRYVGTVVAIDPKKPGWWGEGDEFFYVDDRPPMTPYMPAVAEVPPTLRGTGTEDWVMQAWGGMPVSFPYAGLVEQSGRRVSMYRWYIEDAIPFSRTLKAQLQQQGRDNYRDRSDDISTTALWYQLPPLTPPNPLPPYLERLPAPIQRAEHFSGLNPALAVPVSLTSITDAARYPSTTCQPRAAHSLVLPPGLTPLAGVPFQILGECAGEATAVSLDQPTFLTLPKGPNTLYLLLAADGPRDALALSVTATTPSGSVTIPLRFGDSLDPSEDPWPVPAGKIAVVSEKHLGIQAVYAVPVALPADTIQVQLVPQPGIKATLFAATLL